jgi:hypothetical protein
MRHFTSRPQVSRYDSKQESENVPPRGVVEAPWLPSALRSYGSSDRVSCDSRGPEEAVSSLEDAVRRLEQFQGASLTNRLARYERQFLGADRESAAQLCAEAQIDGSLLTAATTVKQLAGQISVVIHAAGILTALPSILEPGEVVESLSTGAGNTGKAFDLETDRRVAEFKFITWRGGAESIRQNQLFKDFFYLSEADTTKRRDLYVVGLAHPLKFLQSQRSLTSVMSRDARLASNFWQLHGDRFGVVRQYYEHRKDRVTLRDLTPIVPELANGNL